jgi:hypothetical protein
LAFLAAAAFAADQEVVGVIGYDSPNFEVPKADGWAFVKYTITDSMITRFKDNITQAFIGLVGFEFRFETITTNSQASVAKSYFKVGSRPTSKTDGILVGTKAAGGSSASGRRDITAALGVVTSTVSLDIYFGINSESCGACISTAEFKAQAWVTWNGGGLLEPITRQPYRAVDGPYTGDYSLGEGVNGVAAYVDLTVATNIFVKVALETSSSASAVIIVYTQDAPYAGTANPIDQSVVKFRPDEACPPCRTGSYTTSAVNLGPGRWFITPRVGKIGVSGNANFDFAVGIGAVPASGAMVVPSIITAVLASLAALFLL